MNRPRLGHPASSYLLTPFSRARSHMLGGAELEARYLRLPDYVLLSNR